MTKAPKGKGQRGPKPPSLKVIGAMQERRAQGWKIDEIAAHFSMSHGSVSQYVRAIKPPPRVTTKQREQVRMLRSVGYTYKEIAELALLGLPTIKQLCSDVPLPHHYVGQKLPDEVATKIREMRAEGVPFIKIATELNVGWGTVIRYSRDVQTPARNRGHRISPKVVNEIWMQLKLGNDHEDIARTLDVSVQTVRKYEKKAQVRDLIAAGVPEETIAKDTGVTLKQIDVWGRELAREIAPK